MGKLIFMIFLFTILNSALAETYYAEFKGAFVSQDTNVPEFTYEFEYGSTVKIYCHNNVPIDSVYINIRDNIGTMYTIVSDGVVNNEYANNYQFSIVSETTVLFTINELTPIIHNKKFRCLINSEISEDDTMGSLYNTIRINGFNDMNNLNAKYLDPTGSVSFIPPKYPFGSDLVMHCREYDDNDDVFVYVIKGNDFTNVVIHSEVVPGFEESFGIERDNFRTFRFTLYRLSNYYDNSVVVCTNGHTQNSNMDVFDISGFLNLNVPNFDSFDIDLEGETLQFQSGQYETSKMPYGSRVNVYCNDISSENVKITVFSRGQQFYTNTIVDDLTVVDEYVDYYEFQMVNETTCVFTIKDLTSLTDDLSFRCINELDTKYVLIKGYNTIQHASKFMDTNELTNTNKLINVTHPFGDEVHYYTFKNVIILININGTIINQMSLNDEYSEYFSFESSIFEKYRFTIKNMTPALNGVQLIFIVPNINQFVNNYIEGYYYKQIDEPSCTVSSGVLPNRYYCVYGSANPIGVLSYYVQYPNGTIADVTDMATSGILIDNNDFNKNIYELTLNNDFLIDGSIISCNVTQQLPGNYENVVKSCSYPIIG